MTQLSLPPSDVLADLGDLGDLGDIAGLPRARTTAGTAVRAVGQACTRAAWGALRRTALALARLLAWLCAEPARARAAFGGLVVCLALGVGLGLAVGLITARTTTLVLGTIAAQQQR